MIERINPWCLVFVSCMDKCMLGFSESYEHIIFQPPAIQQTESRPVPLLFWIVLATTAISQETKSASFFTSIRTYSLHLSTAISFETFEDCHTGKSILHIFVLDFKYVSLVWSIVQWANSYLDLQRGSFHNVELSFWWWV